MDHEKIIKEMKKSIKTHPYLKKVLKNIMDDGLTEEDALNVMIQSWLMQHHNRYDGDENYD